MTATRILVVRHGETTWNEAGRWQGWIDVDLNPLGVRQAEAAAEHLRAAGSGLGRVHASDLGRARRTAEILAARLGLGPVVPEPDLRERHGGAWQGHTAPEIDAGWPGLRDAWRRGELATIPGGEEEGALEARLLRGIAHVAAAADGAGAAALVVTHHGVLRVLSRLGGDPITGLIPNLGGRWFTWDGALRAGEAVAPPEGVLEHDVAAE